MHPHHSLPEYPAIFFNYYCAWARQNSGGGMALRVEALFWLDSRPNVAFGTGGFLCFVYSLPNYFKGVHESPRLDFFSSKEKK